MFSFVVCSVDAAKLAVMKPSLAACAGSGRYEVVDIDDAPSLCAGWTRGLERAAGDPVVFCHDDISFVVPDLLARIARHLERFDVVGVVGTDRCAGADWSEARIEHAYGAIVHDRGRSPDFCFYGAGADAVADAVGGIQAMDGVLLAARRAAAERIGFDAATFDGWHGHDADFTFRARLAGLRLGVALDPRSCIARWGAMTGDAAPPPAFRGKTCLEPDSGMRAAGRRVHPDHCARRHRCRLRPREPRPPARVVARRGPASPACGRAAARCRAQRLVPLWRPASVQRVPRRAAFRVGAVESTSRWAPAMPDHADVDTLRLPPHSLEAEQSVLGGLLLDNEAADRIGDVVSAVDFYSEAHRVIFDHAVRLIAEAKPADAVTLAESLASAGKLDHVGGLAYLGALVQGVPTAANVRHYAQIVRDRSVLRQLASTAAEIAESAYQPRGRNASQLLDEAETRVMHIAEAGARGRKQYAKLGDLLAGVVERIEELFNREHPDDVTGIATGFTDLDRMTAGLQAGDLVIVAGRPSMGKTALAVNIGEHVALESKRPVAIFSMEMGAHQLALRLIGSVGRLPSQSLRTGRLQAEDWTRLSSALGRLNDAPILIDETPALTVMELRSRARRIARAHSPLGLIIVDYLQLMQASSMGENRATEISEISRSLKALAKELQVPVMALSQLNRSLEQRPNKRPVMSDLRESGAIEQDADVILFIYRDEVYNQDTPDKGVAEIIIGKQRNGPIGTVRLTFLGEYTRFENFAAPGSY
ncbi:Replicative DNA helicase [Burkholderiales bacterium]|nr:Replicative DNA helicase [Burkholderiales bacterium]